MIIHANILDWAAQYDGEPFHAALMDAPYEMQFMGKDWDNTGVAFNPETWRLIARCLHPGAFLFVMAGTINDDLISVAMRQAGLRKYHRAAAWTYGSGFPKATRIDVAVDRKAGVERTKVGTRKHQPKFDAAGHGYRKKDNGFNSKDRATFDVTEPATDLAQAWAGHRYGGQMLKPALESILIFQKPYAGRPVESITATGAGALNVDQSRITSSIPAPADPVYTLRSSRGSAAYIPDLSAEQLHDCLQRIVFALRFGSTDDTAPLHDEGDRDDTQLDPAVCERLQVRLYPNGEWCGLNWSSIPSFQGGCLSCHRFYDEQLRLVQEAAQVSAPLLADALGHICYHPQAPLHSPCLDTGRPSSGCFVLALVKLLLGDDEALCQYIIPYSTPPRNGRYGEASADRVYADGVSFGVKPGPRGGDPAGRWPSNFSLTHHPACERVGVRRVRGGGGAVTGHTKGKDIYDGGWGDRDGQLYARDPDGFETIAAWSCHPDCVVQRLGEQSGESEARANMRGLQVSGAHGGLVEGSGKIKEGTNSLRGHDDSGTAARFFHQSDWMAERLEEADAVGYFAKASRGEREAGLDPRQIALMRTEEGDAAEFKDHPNSGIGNHGKGYHTGEYFNEDTINDGRAKSIDNPYQRGETTRRNTHPTIKPIALTRWLATLLLPPAMYVPRRLLVPFAGVASEMIGAMLAGWEDVTGIELEADHVAIAEARLAYWQQRRWELLDPAAPITAKTSATMDGQLDMFLEEP